jgi:hypothetical protein
MYDGTLGTRGPWQALVTFQQLVILADKHGVVDMTPEAISRRTTIPLKIIQRGMIELEKPDPESRSPEEDGCRIVRLRDDRSWGWRIVNYAHYRQIRSEEERREYHKQFQRKRRAAKAAVNSNVNKSTQHQQSRPIAVSKMQHAECNKQESGARTIISRTVDHFVALFYPREGRRRANVVAQLRSTLDLSRPGVSIGADTWVKARDLAHLDKCCAAVIRKPPKRSDSALRWVLLKLGDPVLDDPGRTMAESAADETRAVIVEETAYEEARSRAVNEWAGGHAAEYDNLKSEAQEMFPTESDFGGSARKSWLAIEISKRNRFPSFKEWSPSTAQAGITQRQISLPFPQSPTEEINEKKTEESVTASSRVGQQDRVDAILYELQVLDPRKPLGQTP